MLEFSVENFRSFADKQTFTMYAKGKDNIAGSTFVCEYKGRDKNESKELFKTSVIYGLNNSGKSNFITVLELFRSIIEYSYEQGLPFKSEPQYFKLKRKYINRPSSFEIIFIGDDKIKYKYSFSLDNIRIHSEKLIGYPKGQPKLYFNREYNKETEKYDYDTRNLIGNSNTQIDGIKGDTRSDCLFLSLAKKVGNEFLKPVLNFLTNKLNSTSMNLILDFYDNEAIDILEKSDEESLKFKDIFKILITNGDNEDIKDINIVNKGLTNLQKAQLDDRLKKTPIDKQEEIKEFFEKTYSRRVQLTKHSIDDFDTDFDLIKHESKGTNKLFSLLGVLYKLRNSGEIFIFDEIDCQLHPKLIVLLIKLIYKFNWNIQLIFTAHNTALMKKKFDIFRKYQIWFCDKDYDSKTILYSAGDSDVKNERDLEELYFNGRFSSMLEDDLIELIEKI